MPASDLQEFQKRYYKIINQIAIKAVDLGDFNITDGAAEFFLDTNENKYEEETDALTELLEDSKKANLDVSEYGFEVKDDLLKKDESMKIFQYFHDISNGEKIGVDIDKLDIPDVNKQEIQAQGFVKAFEAMKSKGANLGEFKKYYANVQSLSMQSDLLEVENPEISSSLDRVDGIFKNFNRVYEKSSKDEGLDLNDMFDKAEKAYDLSGTKEKDKIETQRQREPENRQSQSVETGVTSQSVESTGGLGTKEQKLINLKENLAKKILEVAGVSDKQIDRIMNNPEMKAAMMKRAEKVLKDLEIKEQDILNFGPANVLNKVGEQNLKEKIENQVEELVAQVGRTAVTTTENRDMRGRENLHEKFQSEAVKLDQKAFDKKMGEALKYENKKDKKSKGESLAYNAFYRKPMQLINLLRPEDNKPLFKPWQKALMGVIALAVLAPPFGLIAGALLMGKALDEKTGILTKLAEKILGKGEEREVINKTELDKVNVKDLVVEAEKSQGVDRSISQDKIQQKDVEKVQDKQVERVVNQTEQVTGRTQLQQNVEKSVVTNPEISSKDKFNEIIASKPELKQDLDKLIKTAKDIAGKDAYGKQRSVDDLDLMSAKSRVSDDFKKHKYTGRQ